MKTKFHYVILMLNLLIFTAEGGFTSHKTRDDIEAEKRGSLTDYEGFSFSFSPKKLQNESTKVNGAIVNKYLWDAACASLKSAPIASMDRNCGIILTDWYSKPNQPNKNFKINIFIKGNVVTPRALDVRVFSQDLKNGKIVTSKEETNLASKLEKEILEQAKILYINSNT